MNAFATYTNGVAQVEAVQIVRDVQSQQLLFPPGINITWITDSGAYFVQAITGLVPIADNQWVVGDQGLATVVSPTIFQATYTAVVDVSTVGAIQPVA